MTEQANRGRSIEEYDAEQAQQRADQWAAATQRIHAQMTAEFDHESRPEGWWRDEHFEPDLPRILDFAAEVATKFVVAEHWNEVTLGDGTKAHLVPHGCINVITEPDGHRSCNHGDSVPCERTGHETISLYEVQKWPGDA